jgi:hypothetical protein
MAHPRVFTKLFLESCCGLTQIQEMGAIVDEFIDAFMNIGQSGVLLLLFKAAES